MISYKVIARKKPTTDEVKYYASAVNNDVMTVAQLCEQIALESTITEHDVKAILSALQQHLWSALREGKSVRLGDLGSFHITLKSKGSETREDFATANIDSVMIRFTPSTRFKYNLSKSHPYVNFKRVD